MQCPNCKSELENRLLKDKIYHRCPSCEGFWFDKNELAGLKKDKDWFKIDYKHKDASGKINTSEKKCPRDSSFLKTVNYEPGTEGEDIKVDICSACEGLWLDAGQVHRIHKHEEGFIEKLRETIDDELTAMEVFLAKIGPYMPK
ncbi:MAG: zf-TFIIB domain-containing protein [Elusimicrobia bacterium]|jgi:Zn-finger nucleic acid-binding protein|nr:zf-TFIIB domain-containing protein [Elusimicrobiota bacterium]